MRTIRIDHRAPRSLFFGGRASQATTPVPSTSNRGEAVPIPTLVDSQTPWIAVMPDRARALTLDDLATLGGWSASAHEPQQLYVAVDALVQKAIGHRLFTIMRVARSGNGGRARVQQQRRGVPGRRPQDQAGNAVEQGRAGQGRSVRRAHTGRSARNLRRLPVDIQPRRRIDHERADQLSRTPAGHHEHLARSRLVPRRGCGCRAADRAAACTGIAGRADPAASTKHYQPTA